MAVHLSIKTTKFCEFEHILMIEWPGHYRSLYSVKNSIQVLWIYEDGVQNRQKYCAEFSYRILWALLFGTEFHTVDWAWRRKSRTSGNSTMVKLADLYGLHLMSMEKLTSEMIRIVCALNPSVFKCCWFRCTYCSTLLTVEHILTNCSHYQSIRHKYITSTLIFLILM